MTKAQFEKKRAKILEIRDRIWIAWHKAKMAVRKADQALDEKDRQLERLYVEYEEGEGK